MVRLTAFLLVLVVLVSAVSAQTTKPSTVKLSISGMTCESCVGKVDKALRGVKGVKDVKVDLKNESAEIVLASASVKSEALVNAVVKAGFKAAVGAKPVSPKTEKMDECCPGEGGACEGECSGETKTTKKNTGKS